MKASSIISLFKVVLICLISSLVLSKPTDKNNPTLENLEEYGTSEINFEQYSDFNLLTEMTDQSQEDAFTTTHQLNHYTQSKGYEQSQYQRSLKLLSSKISQKSQQNNENYQQQQQLSHNNFKTNKNFLTKTEGNNEESQDSVISQKLKKCLPGRFQYTNPTNNETVCGYCFDGCSQCEGNPVNCSDCHFKYYLEPVLTTILGTNQTTNSSGRCLPCPPSCIFCTSPTNCSVCQSGYGKLNNNKNNQNGCYLCNTPNCQSCQNGICQTCAYGSFQLQIPSSSQASGNTTVCAPCNLNHCQQCKIEEDNDSDNNTDPSNSDENQDNQNSNSFFDILQNYNLTCTDCPQSTTYKDGMCQQCVSNCAKCNSDIQCAQCIQGYYILNLVQGQFCFKCQTQNCATCWYNGCGTCKSSYYLKNKHFCAPCPKNCLTCQNSEICIECFDGFYMDQNYSCRNCLPGCNQCVDNVTCSYCLTGYLLSEQNNVKKCSKCPKYCAECPQGTDTCQACLPNAALISPNTNNNNSQSQFCYPCSSISPNCQTCSSDKKCYSCSENYILIFQNHTCQLCSGEKTNCRACDPLTYECIGCFVGYALIQQNNTCVQCPKYCPTCQLNSSKVLICTACLPQTSLVPDNTSCYLCGDTPGTQNCNFCQSNTTCQQCLDGYQLNEDKHCIKQTPSEQQQSQNNDNNNGDNDNNHDPQDIDNGNNQEGSGLPAWAIVLIVLAVIFVGLVIVGLAVYFYRKKNQGMNAALVDNSSTGYIEVARDL